LNDLNHCAGVSYLYQINGKQLSKQSLDLASQISLLRSYFAGVAGWTAVKLRHFYFWFTLSNGVGSITQLLCGFSNRLRCFDSRLYLVSTWLVVLLSTRGG